MRRERCSALLHRPNALSSAAQAGRERLQEAEQPLGAALDVAGQARIGPFRRLRALRARGEAEVGRQLGVQLLRQRRVSELRREGSGGSGLTAESSSVPQRTA